MNVEDPVPLFAPFPVEGPWTKVGITRAQFLAIVAASTGLFLLVDGPLWRHVHGAHLTRIAVSYLAIPVLVVVAASRNGTVNPRLVAAATLLIAGVKLVITAALLLAFAIAGIR